MGRRPIAGRYPPCRQLPLSRSTSPLSLGEHGVGIIKHAMPRNASCFAGQFELCHEPPSSIDLDGLHRERHARHQLVAQIRCRARRGTRTHGHATARGPPPIQAGHRQRHRIDLNRLTKACGHSFVLLYVRRVGTGGGRSRTSMSSVRILRHLRLARMRSMVESDGTITRAPKPPFPIAGIGVPGPAPDLFLGRGQLLATCLF